MGPVTWHCHIIIVFGMCSGGGWLNNDCERWVVVGDGGDAAGVVTIMLVVENKRFV
jgi:hypothetical protein